MLVVVIVINVIVNNSNNITSDVSSPTKSTQDDSYNTTPTTTPTTTTSSEIETTAQKEVTNSYIIQNVNNLNQNAYPAGCESVSTTMLLNYLGFDITTDEFINNFLPVVELSVGENGSIVGPSPASVFIGSPYSESGLGCFPPVIEYSVNNYLKTQNSSKKAYDITGTTLDEIIKKYIIHDIPVLIWPTMYMSDTYNTTQWTLEGEKVYSNYKDGDLFYWPANEHCLVLTGYDENYYYCNDPLYDEQIKYDKSIFEQRYEEMGKFSIVIK